MIRRPSLSADAEKALRACIDRPIFLDGAIALDLHYRKLIQPVGERAGRLLYTASLYGLLLVYAPDSWSWSAGQA